MRQTLFNTAKWEHCHLAVTPFSFIQKLKLNLKPPDIETIGLVNDSEYFQRIEMLWGDSVEWL